MAKKAGYIVSLFVAYLIGTLTPIASTQTTPRPPAEVKRYLQVQYMKPNPGKGLAYRRLERELWKPVHEERVKRGLIRSWGLYGVHLPGQTVDYQYVILTEFPNFSSLEDAQYPEIFAEVQGMTDYEDILRQTNETRTRIRQDIWVLVEHTQ